MRARRKYVVHGFELVSDAAYRGNNKAAALPDMLHRSQVLQTVLAHNPQTYVVGSTCKQAVSLAVPISVPVPVQCHWQGHHLQSLV